MKKGFTLIELLAIIVILSGIFVIVVPEINKALTNRKNKEFEEVSTSIKNAAKLYISENFDDDIPSYITLRDLIDNNLLDSPLIDPRDGSEFNLDIIITIQLDEDGVLVYNFDENNVLPSVRTTTIVSNNGINNKYAKNGSIVTLNIKFNKSIKNIPTVTIGGRTATVTGTGKTRTATYTIPIDESSLTEGALPILISNYVDNSDAVGENFFTITSGGNVIYDRTAPIYTYFYIGGLSNPSSINSENTILRSSVTGAYKMCVSSTTDCTTWKNYNDADTYTLELGDGNKTLNAWYMDMAGNSTSMYSDSIILDKTAPTIILSGSGSVYVSQGITYNDAGATATDNVDGDISANIQVTGTVNTSVVGTYTLTYNVSDFAGNEASQVKRIINVTTPSFYAFGCTGDYKTFTAPKTGVYKIELWGAQGGGSNGGKGAYTSGNITLMSGESIYIYVGCTTTTGTGGWNGGGSVIGNVYGGGGATDVRTVSGAWNNTESRNSRIMVAAAGGGRGNGHAGGYGGAPNGANGAGEDIGRGGTSTSGGAGGSLGGGAGGFGYGGSGSWVNEPLGGGGAGYYGGGSGGGTNSNGGGGGGSSYINATTFSNTSMISGAGIMPNPTGGTMTGNAGAGYARIEYLPNEPFSYTFNYTGNFQTFAAPETGYYQIELWGAQGGNTSHNAIGGKGGYSLGTIALTKNQILNIYVGGQNGYNGGGTGGTGSSCENGASGGGATDVRLEGTALENRVIVAGGGGGASGGGGNFYDSSFYGKNGGYGGGGSGSFLGAPTKDYSGAGGAAGGTGAGAGGVSTGGDPAANKPKGASGGNGSLGLGGVGGGIYNNSHDGYGPGAGGGGGGGYYGGGGGGGASGWWGGAGGSGGGGSNYVGGVTNGQMIAGNASMPNPSGGNETGHAGNGYAKITYIGS